MSKFDFITGFFSWGEPDQVKPKVKNKPKNKVEVIETVKEKPVSDKKQRRDKILARLKNRKSDENE